MSVGLTLVDYNVITELQLEIWLFSFFRLFYAYNNIEEINRDKQNPKKYNLTCKKILQ